MICLLQHYTSPSTLFYLISVWIPWASRSCAHTQCLSAARSNQSDPYETTRLDSLMCFQKACVSLCLSLLWLYPDCDPPPYPLWRSRVTKTASVLVRSPLVLNMLPHKHTQADNTHCVSQCPSPSVYLLVVDMNLKISKCPLSIRLSPTPTRHPRLSFNL